MQGELEEEIAPPFRPWMIAVAVTSMAIFIVAVWYAWNAGQSDLDGPPPIVQADDSPVKVAPEEPGGMQVPHQENEVFSAIEDQPQEPTEELLPPPEEPVKMPEPKLAEPEPEAPAQAMQTAAENTPPPAAKPARKPESKPVQPAAAAAQPEPKPTPPAPAAEKPAPASTAGGKYVIQLAALQSREAASEAWSRLVKKYTRQLAPLTLDIEPVNVPNKGTFYRVRGAGFPTREEAESRCAALKAAGQACLVKTR